MMGQLVSKHLITTDKVPFIPHSQKRGCWWFGGSGNQGITNQAFDPVLPKYSNGDEKYMDTRWNIWFGQSIERIYSNSK